MVTAQAVKEAEIKEQDSLLLIKCLLRIAVDNINHIRGLNPEKYLSDKSVSALEAKQKKFMALYTESCRLVDSMEKGLDEALQKTYLKALLDHMCEAIKDPTIEEAVPFSYPDPESPDVINHTVLMKLLDLEDVTMRNLLRIAIYNISYIRGLFPEKYFSDKSVSALDETQDPVEDELHLSRLEEWITSNQFDVLVVLIEGKGYILHLEKSVGEPSISKVGKDKSTVNMPKKLEYEDIQALLYHALPKETIAKVQTPVEGNIRGLFPDKFNGKSVLASRSDGEDSGGDSAGTVNSFRIGRSPSAKRIALSPILRKQGREEDNRDDWRYPYHLEKHTVKGEGVFRSIKVYTFSGLVNRRCWYKVGHLSKDGESLFSWEDCAREIILICERAATKEKQCCKHMSFVHYQVLRNGQRVFLDINGLEVNGRPGRTHAFTETLRFIISAHLLVFPPLLPPC